MRFFLLSWKFYTQYLKGCYQCRIGLARIWNGHPENHSG